MISSTAFRMGRMAAPAVRRTFSTATVHASKSNYARNAMMATAGLAAAVTVLQEREVLEVVVVEAQLDELRQAADGRLDRPVEPVRRERKEKEWGEDSSVY